MVKSSEFHLTCRNATVRPRDPQATRSEIPVAGTRCRTLSHVSALKREALF